ncbi:hypothetical protein DBV15_07180 [Temnothorax longispinosus]|uniref:Uncharacterized protein n=1 Tax=Temnothorax longispinosus TaxID=300112 RepID=A0A4S2JPP7_9HYME|nr:hypothetical protein DBV15_07180 [Temnothorax longispinosus]
MRQWGALPPSQRDCFALILWLNIQSLRHGRLARAILSQPGKSKWYLCPRAIRVATIFPPPSRSVLPHWVMDNIFRGATLRADDSRVRLGGRYRPALNHPAAGGATPNHDNSSRVTTVDRVAKIETVETSSLRRKNGGGWRIWLTPLRSTLGETRRDKPPPWYLRRT